MQNLQLERDFLVQKLEAKKRITTDISEITAAQETARHELRASVKEWRTVHAQQLNAGSPEALKEEHATLTQSLLAHQEALAKRLEKKNSI